MVSKNVHAIFEERLKSVLHLFDLYKFNYAEIGIFGSYARGDYTYFVKEKASVCLKDNLSLFVYE